MNNKHGEFEQDLRDWLMAHDGQRLDPLEVCPGVKLVACTRNPSVVHELIRDGRFGHELGRGIEALILTDESTVSDHEFRVLNGDGYWYALYSIARGGHRQVACLAFEGLAWLLRIQRQRCGGFWGWPRNLAGNC